MSPKEDPSQYTVAELKRLRNGLSNSLHAAVQSRVSQFQEDTGIPVEHIEVTLVDVSALGRPKRSFVHTVRVSFGYEI